MERDTNIAFIPKAPLTTGGSSSRPTSIFFIVGILTFFSVVGAAGGLFVYKNVLEKHLSEQEARIAELRSDYDKNAERAEVIRRAEELGIQVGSVKALLNEHLVLTPLFDFLEAHTLKEVQLASFAFEKDAEAGALTVELGAVTTSYMTAALQREELKQWTAAFQKKDAPLCNGAGQDPCLVSSLTISTPELTEEGSVSFTITLDLNREALRYARSVAPATPVADTAAVDSAPALEVTEIQTTN
ncbi:MAG: hypothetical protein A2408_00590 [Candidatus Yonathbacteria bacterium RIFOXYC1_FULL_52_10]|uniref:Uncharacterized protein n=1 Tax=Candidatus Yonathbacteria bacterium RIFOXYD1_FULL_52_36 TaxID=1802730 RepID=A0A1G2SID5_9BACT|nr:MAG: hypothetical protein A2408_00590 [Candidatus Yonathbacteria bacterium RIFOXYC1_FULL_52_10]OHA84847.1 MAG: hypothetical protein A2591_00755 [Candidatus Yonathbacteria bacterium RIFOXYD1_FULL_52_36]